MANLSLLAKPIHRLFDTLFYDVYFKSSANMSELKDESVDLIVTSPPYNAGKAYEKEMTDTEYFGFILEVLKECYRVLKPDGRFFWNVAFNAMRKGQDGKKGWEVSHFPLAFITEKAIEESGLQIRDYILWDKGAPERGQTSWGSWCSASAPALRHSTEKIFIGYKERWKKKKRGVSSLTTQEFLESCRDNWKDLIPETSDRRHPAPFPVDVPRRAVNLLTYVGDHVCDPFLGSGTTMRVCRFAKRSCTGYELIHNYRPLILEKALLNQRLLTESFTVTDAIDHTPKLDKFMGDENDTDK